jgi:hypothetical protein
MVEVSAVSLEKLCAFSDKTQTLITVDAPLFGSLLVFEGKVLKRKSAVRGKKRETESRLPSPESIVREASRFWIQDHKGVRDRKNREEMAALLEKI